MGYTGLFPRFAPRFELLAPADLPNGYAYTLYVEAGDVEAGIPANAEALASTLDVLLRRNFHYDYCRRLGQLGPTRVRWVRGAGATYLAVCQARGMKLGNIKPALLDRGTEWEAAFEAVEQASV